MKREAVDFFLVEDAHLKIHARLENWSAWCHGRTVRSVQPMFRLYRADNYGRDDYDGPLRRALDPLDAAAVQKGVSALPDKHRHAVNWQYVEHSNPRRKASALGVSVQGLADLVRAGRVMLINRRV